MGDLNHYIFLFGTSLLIPEKMDLSSKSVVDNGWRAASPANSPKGRMHEKLEENRFLFTSESVGEGHPDKVCDQLSDSILDACLAADPQSKVACEAAAKGNHVMLFGEVTLNGGSVNYEQVARRAANSIGYDALEKGLDAGSMEVKLIIEEQEAEIASAVHMGKGEEDLGAGDQGHMFGYATSEWDSESLMPLTHHIASAICMKLAQTRKSGELKWLRPDCKSQVTIEYEKEGGMIKPIRIHTVLVSTQHDESIQLEELRAQIIEMVVKPVIPDEFLDEKVIYYINPSKHFLVGGPAADAGLTGRKIIVDTYGGWAPHGGGAFSGKDPTKVDRSAAYYARYCAKSLVAANLCQRVLVQVSYAIGIAHPLSIYVDSYQTARNGLTDQDLQKIVLENFDFTPYNIIKELKLRRPIYQKTAAYGHFGRMDPDFTWEYPKQLQIDL